MAKKDYDPSMIVVQHEAEAIVIGMDLFDLKRERPVKQNGNVRMVIEYEKEVYVLTVTNSEGKVSNEIIIPFDFKPFKTST